MTEQTERQQAAAELLGVYERLCRAIHKDRPDDLWDDWSALDWQCVGEFLNLIRRLAHTGRIG